MSVFDATADIYDAVRPDYPPALYEDLVALARLEPGDRLLEIGCATGKATRPLLERGFEVVCVEPGPTLAAHARANLGIRVDEGTFEAWAGGGGFALVYAATAWHWLSPDLRFQRAHDVLRPGGHLAIWGAVHAFPAGFDPFFTEIQMIYDEIGESWEGEWPPPAPEDVPDDREEIEGSGLFGNVAVRRYVWSRTYSAEEYVRLLSTFSGHIAMEEAKREQLFREVRTRIDSRPGREVVRHWHAILHVAERLG
jgi:SAM-dependent methyltransferase